VIVYRDYGASNVNNTLLKDHPHVAGAPWPFADCASYLSVSLRHLIRLADANKVKTIRFGRRRLIPDSEVQRLATEGCH
jgi:excisionase family DNA binding protein